MTAKEFIGELNKNKGDKVEGELIKTFLYSLVISIAILGIGYFVKLRYIDSFIEKYSLYLLLASISIALITSMIRQVRAYMNFACMSGMISGFNIGLYIGATNGMLYGSILGMLVGIFIGVWMGKCCGIMGVMEGVMAGFLGGIMGAMTA